jgi:hypothetical protein
MEKRYFPLCFTQIFPLEQQRLKYFFRLIQPPRLENAESLTLFFDNYLSQQN